MSQASVRNFQQKQVIFYESDVDKSLYKIISGKVAFYFNYGMPNEKLIGITTAPNYFGTMNILSGEPAACTAVAIERSMILHLPETELETFPKSDPYNATAVMRSLARTLARANERMEALLNELSEICRMGADADMLAALIESYSDSIRESRVVDEYQPYSMPKVEEIPAPAPAKQPETVANVAGGDAGAMPAPYLAGHRSYPGVIHPEYKKYLIPTEYTCPHCQNKFHGSRIQVSKLIPIRDEREEKRYDLRVSYNDFEMEWHEIVTCPSCYFSSFDNFFRESKSVYRSRYEKKLVGMYDSIAIDFSAERDLDAVFAQHYLALACAPGFTDHRQIVARVWLNLVRLYQDAGEPELADIAEKNALDAYEKVYMEVELAEGQEQRLCLTVAGILYARGEKRAARQWAMKVRQGSGDRSAYWNMAEQLIQDVRAEMEAEKM